MATQLRNSKAEDAFAQLLESNYGLTEGWIDDSGALQDGHFVREHTFARRFESPGADHRAKPVEFGTRVDLWFPQWRIVVEFKAAPLGRAKGNKQWADGYTKTLKAKFRPKWEQVHHSWSNQLSKFQMIVQQAARPQPEDVWQPAPISEWAKVATEPEPETDGILWILVDDHQMSTAPGNIKKYTYKKKHQVEALRATLKHGYGWNPMGVKECGRLLYMYKEMSELSAPKLYEQAYYDSLSVMQQVALNVQLENTKRMILPELHKLDTTEGLHLVPDYVIEPEGEQSSDDPIGMLVKANTVPLVIPPQK